MSVEVAGEGGAGECLVYTMQDSYTAILETLTFTMQNVTPSGSHAVRVKLVSPTQDVLARIDDLNVGADLGTNFYTFGLGLNASACTLPSGLAVTDALPWTELLPGTQIFVQPIDGGGGINSNDLITDVLMHFDRGVPSVQQVPALPLSLLPGSDQAPLPV